MGRSLFTYTVWWLWYAWCVAAAPAASRAALGTATIKGRIALPEEYVLAKDAYASLFSSYADNTYRRRKAFPDAQGGFVFDGVEDGTHSLEIEATPYVFTAVKVVVKDGSVKEALASDVGDVAMPHEPLKMVPLRVTSFFEQRQKFNVMQWLKTPYGMMGFAVFSLLVMPYLKVDPEEYREMKKELSKMTGGGASGNGGGGGGSGDSAQRPKAQ